jgi:hypothetical protein
MLQKLILGNLPMLGISYKGKEKDREYEKRFSDKKEIKKIMKIALKHEIKHFAALSPSFNIFSPKHLEAIKDLEKEYERKIPIIACIGIPVKLRNKKINDFKRWKTHLEYESKEFGKEVIKKIYEDPILNCREKWKENLISAKPYNMKVVERELKVNWDVWEKNIREFSNFNVVWIEPGSETDFLSISRVDLLEELLDRTYEFGYRTILGSHHFGITYTKIKYKKVKKFDGYVTPVNNLGIMMFPTQWEVENNIKKAGFDKKIIIAIKPFAGGRINPKEALNYVFNKIGVNSCMIGVGSVEEAEKDIQIAKSIFEMKL